MDTMLIKREDFSKFLNSIELIQDHCNDAEILDGKLRQRSNDKYTVLLRRPLEDKNYTPEEKEANCFAAYLLVPDELLKKYEDVSNSINSTLFVVSQDVIKYSKMRTAL